MVPSEAKEASVLKDQKEIAVLTVSLVTQGHRVCTKFTLNFILYIKEDMSAFLQKNSHFLTLKVVRALRLT